MCYCLQISVSVCVCECVCVFQSVCICSRPSLTEVNMSRGRRWPGLPSQSASVCVCVCVCVTYNLCVSTVLVRMLCVFVFINKVGVE